MLKLLSILTCLLLLYKIPNINKTLPRMFILRSFILTFTLTSHLFTTSNIFTTDILRSALIILTLWITRLMFNSSSKIFIINKSPSKLNFIITLLRISLTLAFSTSNLIMFYILFEARLIPTLLLIINWGYQPERLFAGIYLILYTITASLPLLVIILSLIFINPYNSLFFLSWSPLPYLPITIWWIIFITALLVKIPLYIVHLWLPKAHVEAPVSGSMILAGVLLKLGRYALIRFSSLFIFQSTHISPIFIMFTIWSATITGLICLRQTDLKSLIAYSSVAHIAIITAAILSCSKISWFGSVSMILAHGLCSSAIFMLANIVYESTNTRSLFLSKGLITYFPALTIWWFIFRAANIAAPPFLNLLREIFLLSRILSKSIIFAPLLMSTGLLAGIYSLHLYTSTQHGSLLTSISPLLLNKPSSHLLALLHISPLILILLKTDTSMSWIWPYSWKTTLNCNFKSVNTSAYIE